MAIRPLRGGRNALATSVRGRSNGRMATMTEPEIVALVTHRLKDMLPHLVPRQIEEEVAAVLSTFTGSKVRSFLPILVEREALVSLRRHSERAAAEPHHEAL